MDLALNNQQWLICHKTKPNFLINMNFANSLILNCISVCEYVHTYMIGRLVGFYGISTLVGYFIHTYAKCQFYFKQFCLV